MTTETEVTEMIRRCARDPDVPREALCKMLELAADHIDGQELAADHIDGQERVWEAARNGAAMSHFEKLGTVSLDGATMLASVYFEGTTIELGRWLSVVPECMRDGAVDAAKKVMGYLYGYRATEENRHHFVGLMNTAIDDAIACGFLTSDGWSS